MIRPTLLLCTFFKRELHWWGEIINSADFMLNCAYCELVLGGANEILAPGTIVH